LRYLSDTIILQLQLQFLFYNEQQMHKTNSSQEKALTTHNQLLIFPVLQVFIISLSDSLSKNNDCTIWHVSLCFHK